MKKILLGLVLLLTTATMNAQVKLEYVLEDYELGQRSIDGGYRSQIDLIGVDDLFLLKNPEYEYCFFDAEGNLHTTLSSTVKDNDIYSYDLIAITRNIFTTDGKICRLVIAYSTETDEVGSLLALGLYIIDADGNIIQKLQNKFEYSDMDVVLIKVANQYKLLIYERKDREKAVYVYSCPGNGEATTSVENVPAKVKRNAYPNPATDLVTLPYDANGATSMKIYDMQGKLVERKFLDKSKQELQLNVKDYPSGMYFFEVNGESNSFIVE